jgi:hypothetical protein
MWTKAFWKGLGERAIKTFFQSGVAAVATAGIEAGVGGVDSVNWISVGSVALLATILSVATSIGNADFTAGGATLKTGGTTTITDGSGATTGEVPIVTAPAVVVSSDGKAQQ